MTDENYLGEQPDKNGKYMTVDLPCWLGKAIEQKNPRVTLALAYSFLLVYDDLDKKLLFLSSLN